MHHFISTSFRFLYPFLLSFLFPEPFYFFFCVNLFLMFFVLLLSLNLFIRLLPSSPLWFFVLSSVKTTQKKKNLIRPSHTSLGLLHFHFIYYFFSLHDSNPVQTIECIVLLPFLHFISHIFFFCSLFRYSLVAIIRTLSQCLFSL